ncbi:MAG: hypothetical protein EBS23_09945, partial [Betaproteobacteria bacterium]|nr:hypothetical protein [Betaproteobacteria bacterium]
LKISNVASLGGLNIGSYGSVTNTSNVTVSSAIDIAGSVDVKGGDITLNTASIVKSAGAAASITLTATNKIDISSNISSTGTNLLSLVLDTGGTSNTTASGTVSGILSGNLALTKRGAGTTTLTAANTYSGGTTVDAGTLELVDNLNTGTGVIRGILTVNASGTVKLSGGLSGGIGNAALGYTAGAQVTQLNINGGRVEATGTQHIFNLSGGLNFNGGGQLVGNSTNSASGYFWEWGNTNVSVTNATSQAQISGHIRLRTDTVQPTFTVASGSASSGLLVSAAITEVYGGGPNGTVVSPRAITKAGAGTMTLSGASTYTGGIDVNAGTLEVTGTLGASASYSGAIAISSGASLTMGSSSAQTLSGVISGAGSIAKSAGSTLTVSGANVYSGGTTVSGGVLQLGATNALGTGAVSVASGATLDLNGLSLTNSQQTLTLSGTGASAGQTSLGALHNSAGHPASVAGSIQLAANTLITSAGDIALNGNIGNATSGGGRSLEVLTLAAQGSSSRVVTLSHDVGTANSRLSSFAVTGSTRLRGNVFTSGAQTFTGDVEVDGDISLSSNMGGVSIFGNLTLSTALTNILEFLGGGAYRFNGTAFSATSMSQPSGVNLSFDAATSLYSWTSPYSGSAQLLVVGGGGGGGGQNGGAGGGAGGLIYNPNFTLSTGSI